MEDPDIRIMERIRDGDQEAVVELVGRFQDELVGFFYHLCWDQLVSEELAQDVFVNIYRARARWMPSARVRTWVYRIAHNLWIDHLRRQRRHLSIDADHDGDRPTVVDELAVPGEDPGAADRDATIRERVGRALAGLPEGQRMVFVMANNQEMRYQEIASVLGILEGTVKSRMHNAVRALRDDLIDLLED